MYELVAEDAATVAGSMAAAFEEALASYVETLPSHQALVAYAVGRGHRTRPVGCLLACDAVGGDWRAALTCAVAVELIHKSSVIRDDIADGDEFRSGQPAVHARFGLGEAIAISDVLWSRALQEVSAVSPSASTGLALRTVIDTLAEMTSGQLEDVAPSAQNLDLEGRLTVDERKTGALSRLACWLGAHVGGGSAKEARALASYGQKLGTAFQVLNDVRNLRGCEDSRAAASDLRRGRQTLLVAYARRVDPQTMSLLEELDADAVVPSHHVAAAQQVIRDCGALEYGERLARRLLEQARQELIVLRPGTSRDILEALSKDALLAYAF